MAAVQLKRCVAHRAAESVRPASAREMGGPSDREGQAPHGTPADLLLGDCSQCCDADVSIALRKVLAEITCFFIED